jgi:sulfhydrogenase subunit beta (sulfur reductase)
MASSITASVLDVDLLAGLIPALQRRGYQVVGPTVRDDAIVYDTVSSLADLPVGWTDFQEPGRYRLQRRAGGALFGSHPGPQSWKKFLHPADLALFNGQPAPKYAFLGVRACELAAIRIQDRILLEDRHPDVIYEARRRGAFIVAVHCTEAAPVCFCSSMQTGPRAETGFDLALTELIDEERHVFALEAGSVKGAELLSELGGREIDPGIRRWADDAIEHAKSQARSVDTSGLREILCDSFEHPRWDDVAVRCLCCANCTMVCPTCFCTTVEDVSDITGDRTERLRKWDSCFTLAFSYIHGGSVRASAKSRYRQWLTHKFAYWIDQFGSSGCVGCGRCITWCPAGIDVTEEIRVIRETTVPPVMAREGRHGIA